MTREAFVDERVIGRQEIQDAAVLLDDAREEELRLALEALSQVVVEVRIEIRIRLDGLEIAQVQPLSREILDERGSARIAEHSAHLRLEHARLVQAALLGEIEQRLVGDTAPDKERQPRRELDVAHEVRGADGDVRRLDFGAKHEGGARQHAPERKLDPSLEAALRTPVFVERQQSRQVGFVDRSAIRAPRECREDFARARLGNCSLR
jgi:hypothetical protein